MKFQDFIDFYGFNSIFKISLRFDTVIQSFNEFFVGFTDLRGRNVDIYDYLNYL